MNKSAEQIQIFYEIAMSIGKILRLHEMLKPALLAYLRKLNCVAGMVYRYNLSDKSESIVVDLFSIPYTLSINKNYAEIDNLIPKSFKENGLAEFCEKLPLSGITTTNQYYHIMKLDNFGFLVLVKKGKFLDNDVILSLKEINDKLAQACLACVNNEALKENEKRLKSNEKYLKTINQFATSVLKQNTIDDIVWEVINLMIKELGFVDCVIYLFDESKKNLIQRAAYGFKNKGKTVKNPIIIPYGEGIVGSVAKTGIPELIADTSKDPRYILDDQMRFSELAVPIVADGEVIGVIDTEHPEKDFYNQEHLDKLETVSGLVSARMKNAISQEKLLLAQVSLTKLSTAVEQSPLSVIITDLDGFIEFVNPAFIVTTGYSAEESIGKKMSILKSGVHPKSHYIELWETIKKGEKWVGEMVNKRKNGENFWILNSISPIKNSIGEITNFVAMHADISAIKKLESDLILSKKNAEEANKAKSEFLANMSHEIRTPMNAILGFSEALYHKLDSREHKKMIESVLNSGNLLLSLLNDILDLSKIEAGKLEISLHPVDIKNILQEIELLFTSTAHNKGIEINTQIALGFPAILKLDEIRIKQVIFNLVGNAIKFTNQGYVNIKASFINTNDNTGQLVIEVKDTGIGIPDKQQKLIFEVFRQQSGQSNRKFGGAGLGLAISKRLVEKMEGSISVASIEGKGSVFSVIIPNIETSSSVIMKKENYKVSEQIVFEKATILVVDDIATNIEVIEDFAISTNLNISSAESGEIALDVLNHITPDLILLDIRMQGIDGYEVAKKIKSDPEKAHIPIVAFTASVFITEDIEKSSDFDDILLKPVKRSELFTKLAKYLKHTIKPASTQIKKKEKDVFENLPEDLLEKLPVIENTLKETFLPQWESIKDTLVLYKIEAFAKDLKQMAEKYKFQILVDYANHIIEDVEIVDLDALKKNLQQFRNIINKISQIVNK